MFKHPDNKTLIVIIIFLAMISLCVILILLLPAVDPFFDFSTGRTANVGSTIGGLTAPVLTIFSSYLVYLALIRQTESNNEQRLKNESDMIFLLINQLDAELSGFYVKQTQGNVVHKYTGLEALNDFGRNYRYEFNIEQFASEPGTSFKAWYEAGQIAVIVDTFNLIEQRISLSPLNEETRKLFRFKLDSYYSGKLKIPFSSLAFAFELYPHQLDDLAQKVIDLVERKGKDQLYAPGSDEVGG
ncbi:MAG: hypothetical protein EOO04_12790 [Chitinophagaceae bacterium]|nr:MAG: hypothetical protein EOO04_12790 [Chitinophagaceae bacterium]